MANDQHSSAARHNYWLQGDWEPRVLVAIQLLFSILGLCFSIAAILIASNSSNQSQSVGRVDTEMTKLQRDGSIIFQQIAAINLKLAEAQSARGELSVDLANFKQNIAAEIDKVTFNTADKLMTSRADLGEVKSSLIGLTLRTTKIEATLQNLATDNMPLGSTLMPKSIPTPTAAQPASSIAGSEPEPRATETSTESDHSAGARSLAPYSIVKVAKDTAELRGPSGSIIVSVGKTFGDEIRVLQITRRKGKLRVVTDRGVITGKVK